MLDKDWLKKHPETVRDVDMATPYLGQEIAEVEWAEDGYPVNVFVHTESFSTFKRTDCHFLFGRRGTGKTSLIRMLDYEIGRSMVPDYESSWIIDAEETFGNLTIQIYGSPLKSLPENALASFTKGLWSWVIELTAMAALARSVLSDPKDDTNIENILAFLARETFDKSNSVLDFADKPLVRLANIIAEELTEVDYDESRLGQAVMRINNRLRDPVQKTAVEQLSAILRGRDKYCLVMVDSIETYNLRDTVMRATTTALISSILEFWKTSAKVRILVKSAFPSELVPHIDTGNRGKTETRSLFILWRYKDLVCFVAKRYSQALQGSEPSDDTDVYDDFDAAQSFLYEHFPQSITTRNGYVFDTLAYVIKHTQKKPRQLISLVNSILSYAVSDGGSIENVPEHVVINGLHARLDVLVKGAMDVYNKIYPNADRIIRRALTTAPSIMTTAKLDEVLKETRPLRSPGNLSKEDAKRLLLESGILGVVSQRHPMGDNRQLVGSLFEYQVKGTLDISSRTESVVHPMCYDEFRTDMNPNMFIYPMPAEDEEVDVLAAAVQGTPS